MSDETMRLSEVVNDALMPNMSRDPSSIDLLPEEVPQRDMRMSISLKRLVLQMFWPYSLDINKPSHLLR